MSKKKRNTTEMQTILVGLAINKLTIGAYGYRNRPVNISKRNSYMDTYKANQIAGRTELRVDLAKQLTTNGKKWRKHDPLRAVQMLTAARSRALT